MWAEEFIGRHLSTEEQTLIYPVLTARFKTTTLLFTDQVRRDRYPEVKQFARHLLARDAMYLGSLGAAAGLPWTSEAETDPSHALHLINTSLATLLRLLLEAQARRQPLLDPLDGSPVSYPALAYRLMEDESALRAEVLHPALPFTAAESAAPADPDRGA